MSLQNDFDKYLNDKGFMAYLESMMPESKKQKIGQVLTISYKACCNSY
jgi:hypothetical protein